MKLPKIALSVFLAAAVLPQAAALLLCGPMGFAMVTVSLWTAGSAIWKLWRYPLTRRYLAGCCAVILMLGGLAWAGVPRLTFRQARERALALPENVLAEAVDQRWGDRMLSGVPAAKNRLTGKGYFVVVAEGGALRSDFVHPATGAVYPNPMQQAGHFRP